MPAYEILRDMPYDELSAVEDFKIFNSLGEIAFLGTTDLTNVNL